MRRAGSSALLIAFVAATALSAAPTPQQRGRSTTPARQACGQTRGQACCGQACSEDRTGGRQVSGRAGHRRTHKGQLLFCSRRAGSGRGRHRHHPAAHAGDADLRHPQSTHLLRRRDPRGSRLRQVHSGDRRPVDEGRSSRPRRGPVRVSYRQGSLRPHRRRRRSGRYESGRSSWQRARDASRFHRGSTRSVCWAKCSTRQRQRGAKWRHQGARWRSSVTFRSPTCPRLHRANDSACLLL